MKDEFLNKYNSLAKSLEVCLAEYVEAEFTDDEISRACRYVLGTPGKRVRPVLCLAVAELLGVKSVQVKPFALALECLHSASLVHDDLPIMDDQAVRRGQPTCHTKFGVATALLVGDALIAKAFSLVANSEIPAETAKNLLNLLASATYSLCQGQALDMAGRLPEPTSSALAEAQLRERHLKKTGALISAAITGPSAWREDFPAASTEALTSYGEQLGLLFQITDDILDVVADGKELGKNSGTDQSTGTSTYVSVYGLDGAKTLAANCADKATKSISVFGGKSGFLKDFPAYILERRK